MTPQHADAKMAQMGPPVQNPTQNPAEGQRHYSLYGRDIGVDHAAPGLHIVATPIGNLGDISLRALETLAGADLIACEDTRQTQKLLQHYEIRKPLVSYHDHNEAAQTGKILDELRRGDVVPVVLAAEEPAVGRGNADLLDGARVRPGLKEQHPGSRVLGEPGGQQAVAAPCPAASGFVMVPKFSRNPAASLAAMPSAVNT